MAPRRPPFRQFGFLGPKRLSLRGAPILAHEPNAAPLNSRNAEILVVDDTNQVLQVLASTLLGEGYRVSLAKDGAMALEVLRKKHFDLVLLDVMMPQINGFEVCRQIQADESLREIPVIFMTAKSGTSDRVEGFNAGAVDYITKPFQLEELLARVRIHLELKWSRDRISSQNRELRELNQQKDLLFSIVSHDLKNPLSSIMAFSELLASRLAELGLARESEHSAAILDSARQAQRLLGDLRVWTSLDSGRTRALPHELDLAELLKQIGKTWAMRFAAKDIALHVETPAQPIAVSADSQMLADSLGRLLDNALKFSTPGNPVRLSVREEKGWLVLAIYDQGAGISPQRMKSLVESHSESPEQEKPGERGTGLGLRIAQAQVKANGGFLRLSSVEGRGTVASVFLPKGP